MGCLECNTMYCPFANVCSRILSSAGVTVVSDILRNVPAQYPLITSQYHPVNKFPWGTARCGLDRIGSVSTIFAGVVTSPLLTKS